MSLDDDIKQALHRHESDVHQPARAWNDIERSVRRGHRVRSAAVSLGAAAAIAAVAIVVPQLSSKQNPAPIITAPPTETNQPTPTTSPAPVTPQLLAKIDVSAYKLAAGGDSIWALRATGENGAVVRINGATNEVTARIPVGVKPHAISALADQVWVANDNSVMRINPATNQVIATVDVRVPMDLAVEPGAVWVVKAEGTSTTLLRIDPATNTIDKTYALKDAGGNSAVAVGEGYVWVAESTASPNDPGASQTWSLERIDPTSGETRTATFDTFANPMIGVATSTGAVWVSTIGTTSASALDRIDPDTLKVAARFELPDASPVGGPNAITTGEGYLWAVGERGQFWKVDITKNAPVGNHLNVGEAPPINAPDVVTGFGSVWIATDDGHIWRYAP